MAKNISFSDTLGSFQILKFIKNEDKENSVNKTSFLDHNAFESSLSESFALISNNENYWNVTSIESKKNGSDPTCVANFSCDICGAYFESRYHLRNHHFTCIKDKPCKYTECDLPVSKEIHMCKHLFLNGSAGKISPNLILGINGCLNRKSDYFALESDVETVKNLKFDGPVLTNDSHASWNEGKASNELVEHNTVESEIRKKDVQNAGIECVQCNNDEKSVSDNLSVSKPPFSEFTYDKEFTTLTNLNSHRHTHIMQKCNNQFSQKPNSGKYCPVSDLDIPSQICTKTLVLKPNLKHHICDKNFDKRKSLLFHHFRHLTVKPYKCIKCGKKFSHKYGLQRHLRIHSHKKFSSVIKKRPYTYNFFTRSFTYQSRLKFRHPIHVKGEFKCTACCKDFNEKSTFESHMLTHIDKKAQKCSQVVKKKPYACNFCTRSFTYQSRLKFHQKIHTNAREFKCTVCSKGFNVRSTLKSHMLTHSDERAHECSICHQKFRIKSSLTRHLENHAGNKPHECDVCSYRFSTLGKLKAHYRTHTGELPYECDICQKKFKRRSGLNAHVANHTGNLKHECDICQKKFFHKQALNTHKSLVHTKDKKFVCEFCEKSYLTKHLLKEHIFMHTGEKPYVCSYCNKGFARKHFIDRHILIHTGEQPYKCEICNKLFNQKNSLDRHQVVHTKEKPYSCEICQKSFTQKSYLSIHMLAHTGEKPYNCQFCDKSFSRKSSLNKHACRKVDIESDE